jgi:ribosomal protein S24E
MNLQIVEQKMNPLLSRKEIKARLTYDKATPSKDELKKQIASGMKTSADLLVIKHIYPAYGDRRAEVLFYLYDTPESVKKIEGEKKTKKKPAKGAGEKKEEKAEAE